MNMSYQGELAGIFISPTNGAPLHSVDAVDAVTGKGLAGDRHFDASRTLKGKVLQVGEVSLIEQEALDAILREEGIAMEPHLTRRNLLTRGVPLNHLVGLEFRVGDVLLRGFELCEPCGHMERLSKVKGVRKALIHRGGLRAHIIEGGTLHPGDVIRPYTP